MLSLSGNSTGNSSRCVFLSFSGLSLVFLSIVLNAAERSAGIWEIIAGRGVYVADAGGKTGVLPREAGLESAPRLAVAIFRVISSTVLIISGKNIFSTKYYVYPESGECELIACKNWIQTEVWWRTLDN